MSASVVDLSAQRRYVTRARRTSYGNRILAISLERNRNNFIMSSSRALKQINDNQETENWMPGLAKFILNLEDMEVINLDKVNPRIVIDDLTLSKHIGLSLISEKENSLERNLIAVCLTTKERIFVIDPYQQKNLKFLDKQLKRHDIKFYTIDGCWDADMLEKFKIHLSNQIDLVAFGAYLSMRKVTDEGGLCSSDIASVQLIREKLRPKQFKYPLLVHKYLEASFNLNIGHDEVRAVKDFKFDLLAKNAIKKRAALVRVLTLRMTEEYDKQRLNPTKALISLASRASDEIREEYERSGSRDYFDLCRTLSACPEML